jgi:hypothetical protein
MRRLAFALVAFVIPAVAVAQSVKAEAPQAWEWTLEERLNDRLDPGKIHGRDEAANPGQVQAMSTPRTYDEAIAGIKKGRQFEYSIDGSRNPELFLSFELFDWILSGLSPDASLRAKQRLSYEKRLRSLGYDDEVFWTSLASVSGNYLAVKEEACYTQACGDARCAARHDALEAARQLFGREEFNRMLYIIVAPYSRQATATLDPNYRAALRRQETGCR